MSAPQDPRLDERRLKEFFAELGDRAQAWIPTWGLADGQHDFGRALLQIAARFNSEVAERLDRTGDKMRRGFLDWLSVPRKAARPARVPVVFRLADSAQEAVLASAPVQLQADAAGTPVVFETEEDVRVVPGRLAVVVGIDTEKDAYFLPPLGPPLGLSDLQPAEPLPTQWRLKSFASAGATKLQLDPELGLAEGLILGANGRQYRIVKLDKDLVTIEPPLETELAESTLISKVMTFSPFDGEARNWQEHVLYLGDDELLNIESEATIEIVGAIELREGYAWEYSGKRDPNDEVDWVPFKLDDNRQKVVNDALVLTKLKGEVLQKKIGEKDSAVNCRWIRAFRKTVGPADKPFSADGLSIRVNASACGNQPTVCPPTDITESPVADAMANSTPLVLDNIFLPFGREPRQFDAFYLGSAEAFSKEGAQVRICFELADPTFESLAAVRGSGPFANRVIVGVGRDNGLHLFQFIPQDGTISRLFDRDALRPPIPGDSGTVPASTKPLGLNPKCRPVIRTANYDFFVEVASAGTIWTWHENANDEKLSGWQAAFDPLPEDPDDPARIDDIVPIIKGSQPLKVVLSSCRLLVHDGTEWSQKEMSDNTGAPLGLTLVALSPIWEDAGGGLDGLQAGADMVGVSSDNRLYRVTTDGECTALPLIFGPNDEELVDAGTAPANSTCSLGAIRPAAHLVGTTLTVVSANQARNKLVVYRGDPDSNIAPLVDRIVLPSNDQIIGATVELSFVKAELQFSVLCKTPAGGTYAASWQPFAAGTIVKDVLFRSNVSSLGSLGGAPVTLPAHIVAPGARGDLFVAAFNSSQRHELALPAANPDEDGVVLSSTVDPFVPGDAFSVDNNPDAYAVVEALNIPPDPEILYPVAPPVGPVGNDPELRAYRRNDPPNPPFNGIINDPTHLALDNPNDTKTVQGTFLLIRDQAINEEVSEVISIQTNIAELFPPLSLTGQVSYWVPEAVVGRIAPIIRLDPVSSGTWPASILENARLYFTGSVEPQVQRAKVFAPDKTSHPTVIALQTPWVTSPAASANYVIDATLGDWQHLLADTSSNPEISWEYSNGAAWESLILEEETTINFKNTGAVRFRVPSNIAAVDWAGKTNHWIRARLIGGDYGREQVTVRTKTLPNETEQTIERSSKDIRAPSVIRLHISYGFCKEVPPKFVLAEDSGTIRDQSEANRTAGAIVEAFVPLAEMLRRLSDAAVSLPVTDDCPPECNGKARQPEAAQPSADAPSLSSRSLFIGLDATPSEAPVNVLLLVEERNHTLFAPMTIEALIANRFERIIANDATRALGESGVLGMTFTIPPTRADLFSQKGLTWLRLTPRANPSGEWKPALRGAYLNAVWASAAESLTRELLGSSDGAPNMVVRLARPPVLLNTLELRVKEPLDDQEHAQLHKENPANVVSEVSELDGRTSHWVLWKQVVDPNDEPPDARVYALDESIGEIRFGDGRHGRIPPIGRDSIVAFRYKRTEPGSAENGTVPGNLIAARTSLNLVSPVATVETVTAADEAAGGAPPENDDRVLRFGYSRLRHRDRAVTLQDLEDLTGESSPDIAQAHAFARHGSVRLVVIMRGKKPAPTTAQRRELRTYLLARAPASLGMTNALRIAGPNIRRLRLELTLRVSSLDKAGRLGNWVKEKVERFFDTSTGGVDEGGWPLGASPSEDDLAFALLDAADLESIKKITLYEVDADDGEQPWPALLKPTELAMLDPDPLRIHFETSEEPI